MKLHLLLLFVVTCAFTLTDQWLTQLTQTEIGNPQGASNMVWVYGLATIVAGMTFPLISTLIVFSYFKKQSAFYFTKKFFSQSFKEILRGWGRALSWSFLLVIPGLIKFCQYFFIPFVVCFDSAYQKGEVDALERSREISQGRLLKLMGLLILFDVIMPIVLSAFDEYSQLLETPLQGLLFCFVEMLINICFIVVLWRMYEPRFSMERN